MKILSLFDGISCGQIAAIKAGIEITHYYASEIEQNSIKITQHNFPKTIQMGNVTNIKESHFINKIDLLLGGSPCQDLTNVNTKDGAKSQLGLNGQKSNLFYEYVRLLKSLNPTYFLFENVGSMQKEAKEIITKELGVKPIKICSSFFVPQIRNRLYWTNIPVEIPEDKPSYSVYDILETDIPDKYYLSDKMKAYVMATNAKFIQKNEINKIIASPLTATMHKMHRAGTYNYYQDAKGLRKLMPIECERLMGIPDNYTFGSDTARLKSIGNGWECNTIAHILKGIQK